MRRLTTALEPLTGSRRPEQVIRARAEALLAYLAHVPVAVLVANNRARYVDANRNAVALTGYSRAELIGMHLSDLTPDGNHATAQRLWRAFLRRGRMGGRFELRRKNGTVIAADYLAVAHVLPGVHVSALVAVKGVKPSKPRAAAQPARRRPRRRSTNRR